MHFQFLVLKHFDRCHKGDAGEQDDPAPAEQGLDLNSLDGLTVKYFHGYDRLPLYRIQCRWLWFVVGLNTVTIRITCQITSIWQV